MLSHFKWLKLDFHAKVIISGWIFGKTTQMLELIRYKPHEVLERPMYSEKVAVWHGIFFYFLQFFQITSGVSTMSHLQIVWLSHWRYFWQIILWSEAWSVGICATLRVFSLPRLAYDKRMKGRATLWVQTFEQENCSHR